MGLHKHVAKNQALFLNCYYYVSPLPELNLLFKHNYINY